MPLNDGVQSDASLGELELSSLLVRQIAFRLLNRFVQLVAQIFLNKINERADSLRMECLGFDAVQHVHHFLSAKEGQVMPTLQLEINPIRNREDLIHGSHFGSGPKSGRNDVTNHFGVKRVTGQANARVAE